MVASSPPSFLISLISSFLLAGTLTQNNMVVSKLWLAGHLLPDLKPYTRRETRHQDGAGLAARALAAAGSGDAARAGGGGDAAAGPLPPPSLVELVRSTVSTASLGGSGSADDADAALFASRASILESITAGSAAPADVTQLLVESIALNSTANIYSDKDGGSSILFSQFYVILDNLVLCLGGGPVAARARLASPRLWSRCHCHGPLGQSTLSPQSAAAGPAWAEGGSTLAIPLASRPTAPAPDACPPPQARSGAPATAPRLRCWTLPVCWVLTPAPCGGSSASWRR